MYKTQNQCSGGAAAQPEVRRSLHESSALAGTEPAAKQHSNIPARPRGTTKVTARACASFRRRNGEEINPGLLSETSVQRIARPSSARIACLDRRTSRQKFPHVLHAHQ